jgi:hypothetical protein
MNTVTQNFKYELYRNCRFLLIYVYSRIRFNTEDTQVFSGVFGMLEVYVLSYELKCLKHLLKSCL